MLGTTKGGRYVVLDHSEITSPVSHNTHDTAVKVLVIFKCTQVGVDMGGHLCLCLSLQHLWDIYGRHIASTVISVFFFCSNVKLTRDSLFTPPSWWRVVRTKSVKKDLFLKLFGQNTSASVENPASIKKACDNGAWFKGKVVAKDGTDPYDISLATFTQRLSCYNPKSLPSGQPGLDIYTTHVRWT